MTAPAAQWRTLAEVLAGRAAEQRDALAFEFLAAGEETGRRVSFGALGQRVEAQAAALREHFAPGDRVVLLYRDGFDFIPSFLGCLRAGVAAVPVFPPHPARLDSTLPRLRGIAANAEASGVLSTADVLPMRDALADRAPELARLRWLATDTIDLEEPTSVLPFPAPEQLAYLQYTSGSTGEPKGVRISHANLMHNEAAIRRAFDVTSNEIWVSWLPLFHDMGLIGNVLAPIYNARPATLMSPLAFLQKPLRWLQAISRRRATGSGGPNFAFELCVDRISPKERQGLDLSCWEVAYCGAEPVRADTLERFSEAFACCGFRKEAFFPCYGLAEATLFVAGGPRAGGPRVQRFDAAALEQHRAVTAAAGARARDLVSVGRLAADTELAIVDPERGKRCPPGAIGEIWLRGASVASGYWQRPEESALVFGGRLSDSDEGPFLRTGDLGFTDGDRLFITGRLKEMLIVRGRNHYPQDLEATVQACDPQLRPGCGIAFCADADAEAAGQIVVVQEVQGSEPPPPEALSALGQQVRARLALEHGIALGELVLVPPKSIPKTSSGKLRRRACRDAHAEGSLDTWARWRASDASAIPTAPTPTPDEGPGPAAIEAWLVQHIGALTGVASEDLVATRSFSELGLDSSAAVALAGDFEEFLGRPVSPTLFYEYPSIQHLVRGLAAHRDDPGIRAPRAALQGEPLAIVGIACRFPGASDPERFWELLQNGRDAIATAPESRPELHTRDGAPLVGGFLEDVAGFDARFFGIGPTEAETMDPQQRLMLEVSHEALEDAGVALNTLEGSSTGVFVGISTSEYAWLQFSQHVAPNPYLGTGGALSIAANRISYALGLQGPSLAVDTACSSSLVAVHLAAQSLARGECDLAIAGGVNLILSANVSEALAEAGVFAADARCKTFDARADGYVRGEGAGAVVLKPFGRALADGDRIYALLRGTATNNDGASNGLMAPSPRAQEQVLEAAYRAADWIPSSVDYIEAHGTGTQLGDPIETGALGRVVGRDRQMSPCWIGSVKTNVGHLESAAGIAGLLKTILALHRREIPASLNYETPNPMIPFADLGLAVASENVPWPERSHPPRAGVSSFGFGGANAHVVLEAWTQGSEDPEPNASPWQLVPLTARNPEALRERGAQLAGWLGRETEADDFRDAVYTLSRRRVHFERRAALVARSGSEASACAEAWLAGGKPWNLAVGPERSTRPGDVVFLFSGQGSQWAQMGLALAKEEPVFADALEACAAALAPHVDWQLQDELARDAAHSRFDRADIAQPAIFAVQVALARLWRHWGLEPDAVVGHSMGEAAAAHVAGALSLEDAALVIAARSRLLQSIAGQGTMALVELSAQEAETRLVGDPDVSVSAYNGPRTLLWSGPQQAIAAWLERLVAEDIFARPLAVVNAGHSRFVDPLLPELERALAEVEPQPGTVPFHSTVESEMVPGTALDARYWTRNLRQPVRLWPVVAELRETGSTSWIELSPHPVLLPAIASPLRELGSDDGAITLVDSLRRDREGRSAPLVSLAALYAAGHDVAWEAVVPERRRVVSLPNYPWARRRCWFKPRAPVGGTAMRPGAHPLLSRALQSADAPDRRYFEGELHAASLPHLQDHRVGEAAVLAATAIVELVAAAALESWGPGPLRLHDLRFERALRLPEGDPLTLQLVFEGDAVEPRARWQIATRSDRDAPWSVHARGFVERREPSTTADGEPATLESVRARCREPFQDAAAYYTTLEELGLGYGPAYRHIAELWRGPHRALGRLEWSAEEPAGELGRLHPALLDAAFQVTGAALGDRAVTAPYLPVALDVLELPAAPVGEQFWGAAELRPTSDDCDDPIVDVTLRDDAGRLLANARGLRLHGLESSPPKQLCYRLAWRAQQCDENTVRPLEGPWLLFADEFGVAAELARELEAEGATCVRVRPGAAFRAIDSQCAELDPACPEHFEALINLHSRWTGAVHLWNLDMPPPEQMDLEDLAGAETLGPTAVLFAVQALARRGDPHAPRLWLATRGSVCPDDEPSALHPGQAPLWGFGRSMHFEHPEFQTTCVDLDPKREPRDAASLLLRELRHADAETDIALRDNDRFVARLVPTEWPTPSAKPPVAAGDRHFRLTQDPAGTLEGLTWRECAARAPGPEEVEIAVRSAGLNFKDVLTALGVVPSPVDDEIVFGSECAGIVTRTGGSVDFAPGDRVVAAAPQCFGRTVTVDARFVDRIPPGLELEEAATLPTAFVTAVYALERVAHLRRGEAILIHAAAGGVGQAALQLARRCGARVFATAGSSGKRAYLEGQGVEGVFSSRSLDFADAILECTGGRGVDVVLNSLAGDAIEAGLRALAPRGRFVELGLRDILANRPIGLKPFEKGIQFSAVDLSKLWQEEPGEYRALLLEVLARVASGELEALPHRVFPAGSIADAFRWMAQGHHLGKVVLSFEGAEALAIEPAQISSTGSYVITGGLGGLGLAVAGWLVAQGARQLVLVGRRGAHTAAAREAVAALEARGAHVQVEALDVADPAAVAALFDRLDAQGLPVRGVVHAAVVLEDATLLQLDRASFARVTAPKIRGAWNLHRATEHRPLDFFVLFSSVASLTGSPGQANYCAANAFLDALAYYRRSRGLPAQSQSWGSWGEIGQAAADTRRGARLAFRGLRPIAPDLGLRCFGDLLRTSTPHVGIMDLDLRQWLQFYPALAQAPLIAELVEARPASEPIRNTPLRQALRDLPTPEARHAHLLATLRQLVADVLGADPQDLDPHTPLQELGIDSLMGLELRNQLEHLLGQPVPTTLLFAHPQPQQLALALLERLGLGNADQPREASEVIEEVAASDEEVHTQLEAELAELSEHFDLDSDDE